MIKIKTAHNTLTDIGEVFIKTAADVLTPIAEVYAKTDENTLSLLYENRPEPPSALSVDWSDIPEMDQWVEFIAVATPNSKGDAVEYAFDVMDVRGDTIETRGWSASNSFTCTTEGVSSVLISARSVRNGKYSVAVREYATFV